MRPYRWQRPSPGLLRSSVARKGEHIIVTWNGRAVACLGPWPSRKPIKYGELTGLFLAEDLAIPDEVVRDFEPSK